MRTESWHDPSLSVILGTAVHASPVSTVQLALLGWVQAGEWKSPGPAHGWLQRSLRDLVSALPESSPLGYGGIGMGELLC